MNGIKFLIALVAACILIVPAFSMPDHGMGSDCKQKSCDCQCGCQKPMIGQEDKQKTCDCEKCDCQQSMMGQDDKQMWQGHDDKQKAYGCPESMMGQDDKQMWQGHDDKQKAYGCPESMMGQDDKQKMCDLKPKMEQDGKQMWQGQDGKHIKSMMGPECDQIGHKHIKSMMGDREKGDNGGIKVVIVNLHV
jgi:hypothetical protein